MKRNVLLATLLAISSVAASGKSIVISPSPNITRNAGTDIPFVFTASGFAAGATATIYLVNAKTWVATVLEENVPVVNGVNNHPVSIPWSWPSYFPPIRPFDRWEWDEGEVIGAVGHNVLKIVSGTAHATDARVVTIRSAVIWPYYGTVYPKDGIGWVTWVIGSYASLLEFHLVNEDTSESYGLGYLLLSVLDFSFEEDPGRFQFTLPYGVTGNHFRIIINAIAVYPQQQTDPEDPSSGDTQFFLVESTRSALVSIR